MDTAVLVNQDIPDSSVETLGGMDMTVRRNAFGRQKDSFEAELLIPVLGEKPFPGVFPGYEVDSLLSCYKCMIISLIPYLLYPIYLILSICHLKL